MSHTITGRHLVEGSWTATGTHTFHAVDAATGTPLDASFHEATATDVDAAVRAAVVAFPRFRRLPGTARARFLDAVADALTDDVDAIVDRAMRESGLPEARLRGEMVRTTGQVRMFAQLLREGSWVDARIDRADRTRHPAPKPDVRRMRVPLGPVVVFGASNFPLAFSVAGGDTASALAAGCPVVVKAHPAHPGTSELVAASVARAAQASDVPPGVFSMVQGASHDVGRMLVLHPDVEAVGFTGSFGGGKALFDAAATRRRPIPVFAEMGSTNPVFVLPDALRRDAASIAEGLVGSFTLGVGQFCTNPGVSVIVEGPGAEVFRSTLAAATRSASPGTMLHAGIRASFDDGIARLSAVPGVRLLARSTAATPAAAPQGIPTVLEVDAATFLERPALAEEVFGPSTILVVAASVEELRRVAASIGGHLTSTLWATHADVETHGDLADVLAHQVGRLIVNGFPTGVEVSPAMQHGGPFPATTDPRFTSVGTAAIERFVRPVAYQDAPAALLPPELLDDNPLGIWRTIDGVLTRTPVGETEPSE